MQSDSGSWYIDSGTLYYFHKFMVEFTQDDIPQDYEEEVHDPRLCGRFRYCHALFDRRNDADPIVLCNMFRDKLFGESTRFTQWEHEVPEQFKVNRGSEIFNYIDSVSRAEINKNIDKFLIIVKFGVFKVHTDSYRDDFGDDESGFGPASKSSIDALEEVSDLGPEFECVICLEEGEKKVKCMPCGHAFHGRCIEEWLEKNNLCPLCRYAMPRDS
ncbi:hypothetical protein V6N13_109323 [Hibiscus sabdariffa]|uniref:RING-type E3 ubiquitin transferase n=1 Tax=Hibiscus sabdariffa TaxID=183260 RepID=A0ABR2FPB8_9ROSI